MWNEGGGAEYHSEQQEEIRADMREAWLPTQHELAEMERCDTYIAENLNLVPSSYLSYSDWFDLVKESRELGEATDLDIRSSDLYDAAMRIYYDELEHLEAEESAAPESSPSGP